MIIYFIKNEENNRKWAWVLGGMLMMFKSLKNSVFECDRQEKMRQKGISFVLHDFLKKMIIKIKFGSCSKNQFKQDKILIF